MFFIVLFLIELAILFFSSRLMTKSISFLPLTLISFIFLPGIIIHELSHLLVASLLFVPTGEIEFMPKVEGQSIKLGSVGIGKTDPLRRFLIGVAPVVLGILVIGVSLYFITPYLKISYVDILAFYVLFVVGNTMFSSKKDLEGSVILLILIVILGLASYLAGFRVPSAFFTNIFSKGEILRQVDYFLPVVVALNLTLYAIGEKVRGRY